MGNLLKAGICISLSSLLLLGSCNKKEFLETSPSTDLFIPTTLDDFQALLDLDVEMNETPVLGELSSDNFYTIPFIWNGLNIKEKNAYIWQKDVFEGQSGISDWNLPYKQVFYANVILDGLSHLPINSSNEVRWKAIKGAALFARAHAFYHISQVFAPIYDQPTATATMGIPLRLKPGVDEVSVRSNLQETYDRIRVDLKEACQLLPTEIPLLNRNRSSRPAAYALLARTYLSMDDYYNARNYADSCLRLYNALIDYNTVPNSSVPFKKDNAESIFYSRFVTTTNNTIGTNLLKGVTSGYCIVDSNLYRSYNTNDLRSIIFFMLNSSSNNIVPKGSYAGGLFLYTGIATDEVYLIRAECAARLGDITAAMNDLNSLLIKRWRTGTFSAYTASTKEEALRLVLEERRKELPYRGTRWTDLRRFNKMGANISVTRKLDNQTYTLPANDLRWTLPIPPDVINLSNMPQNPR